MLPKKNKLPIQGFPLKRGAVFRSPSVVVKSMPNNLPYNRAGVIVGKKSAQSIAKRNELKRLVFRKLGEAGEAEKTKSGKDLLFIVSPSGAKDKSIVSRDVERALRAITKRT